MSGNERGAEIARNAHLIELQKGSIELGAKHASCQKITWAEEVAGTVGGAPGKIGKRTGEQSSGTHQPVVAYYIYTAIPGAAKPVLCVAHYPTSHPELEKDVVTAFTGLKLEK